MSKCKEKRNIGFTNLSEALGSRNSFFFYTFSSHGLLTGMAGVASPAQRSGHLEVTKPAWPGARRPPSPTLSPGYFHRVSPPYKAGQGPSGEEGREGEDGVGLCLKVKVSQTLYLPSWGQLNFSDHLLLHKGSTPERPTME